MAREDMGARARLAGALAQQLEFLIDRLADTGAPIKGAPRLSKRLQCGHFVPLDAVELKCGPCHAWQEDVEAMLRDGPLVPSMIKRPSL